MLDPIYGDRRCPTCGTVRARALDPCWYCAKQKPTEDDAAAACAETIRKEIDAEFARELDAKMAAAIEKHADVLRTSPATAVHSAALRALYHVDFPAGADPTPVAQACNTIAYFIESHGSRDALPVDDLAAAIDVIHAENKTLRLALAALQAAHDRMKAELAKSRQDFNDLLRQLPDDD